MRRQVSSNVRTTVANGGTAEERELKEQGRAKITLYYKCKNIV